MARVYGPGAVVPYVPDWKIAERTPCPNAATLATEYLRAT